MHDWLIELCTIAGTHGFELNASTESCVLIFSVEADGLAQSTWKAQTASWSTPQPRLSSSACTRNSGEWSGGNFGPSTFAGWSIDICCTPLSCGGWPSFSCTG